VHTTNDNNLGVPKVVQAGGMQSRAAVDLGVETVDISQRACLRPGLVAQPDWLFWIVASFGYRIPYVL
jgi:hypothetical protein